MDNTEQISFIPIPQEDSWNPFSGLETDRLLDYLKLNDESRQVLLDETIETLSKCGNPSKSTNSEIGLCFGYVQSGKTMSFTTLTALAKDNGYQLIIIIAGISTNLVDQSITRLERDLQLDTRNDLQWLSFKNPKPDDSTKRNQIASAFAEWRDPDFPEDERKTILITVMKQRNHLPNLTALLQTIDLKNVPTLIIDDEADQHSLNTRARQNVQTGQKQMSPIYSHLLNLRNQIPHHTFVQYTATPQGPLFIDIMSDALSPNFIQILTPGKEYTGGRAFFKNTTHLVEVIDDIDPDQDPVTPPQSLQHALKLFYLGVVKGIKNGREGKNRSMMIHPSQRTYTHNDYGRFVTQLRQNFLDLLALPENNPDRIDLIREFRAAYDDLTRTVQDIPSFEYFTDARLRQVINGTVIQPLNSRPGNTTIVEWRNSYSWILIGGQAMDRGFTVEGLTVTYMPRSIGVGNADSLQQRARFFGYKSRYLGYCRVYLDLDARDAYVAYIEHEEDMRRRLLEHKASGMHLNDWYREVFFPSEIRNPTRRNILSNELERAMYGKEWYYPKYPHNSMGIIHANQQILQKFLNDNHFQEVKDNTYRQAQLPLNSVFEQLLSDLRFTELKDGRDYQTLLYILSLILEDNPDITCTLFQFGSFDAPRTRSLLDNNQINQLFQGRSGKKESVRSIRGNGITFQIYILNLKREDSIVYSAVPIIAISIPEEMGKEVIRIVV